MRACNRPTGPTGPIRVRGQGPVPVRTAPCPYWPPAVPTKIHGAGPGFVYRACRHPNGPRAATPRCRRPPCALNSCAIVLRARVRAPGSRARTRGPTYTLRMGVYVYTSMHTGGIFYGRDFFYKYTRQVKTCIRNERLWERLPWWRSWGLAVILCVRRIHADKCRLLFLSTCRISNCCMSHEHGAGPSGSERPA